MSLNQKILVYAECPKPQQTIIRWRDSRSDSDCIVATSKGEARSVCVAPDDVRAAVSCWIIEPHPGRNWQTIVVERDGNLREVAPDWRAVGWIGSQRLVMAREIAKVGQICILDISSGDMQTIYP